jgi:integrase
MLLIWGQIGDKLRLRCIYVDHARLDRDTPLAYDSAEVRMASLERRGGRFRIVFRYDGQRFRHALDTQDEATATGSLARLEENLQLLNRGRLELPANVDLPIFLLSDGRLNGKPVIAKSVTLEEFFERYKEHAQNGAKEAYTVYIETIHMAHLTRILGKRFRLETITSENLQKYVDSRSKEKGPRGDAISRETVRKEIGTFASIWNKFGRTLGLVSSPAPTRGLIYRKSKGKPPFQTWDQIERQIQRSSFSAAETRELWGSLYLRLSEIEELLEYVRTNASAEFVYPMFAFAAYTGARRSEMLRSRVDDFDFDATVVRIREKKKDRDKEMTFRHVPATAALTRIMSEWLAKHPGGQLTLCQRANTPVTAPMSAHHFVWTLEGSKWAKLKGWHTFRHSFASNCALKAVDPRMIDEWMGHQTEQMRRRYRHLFPEHQQRAIDAVFGV